MRYSKIKALLRRSRFVQSGDSVSGKHKKNRALTQELADISNSIASHNLRLVVSIVKKFVKRDGVPMSFLLSAGNEGLVRAIETFDVYRGVRFYTYATWVIRAFVLAEIKNHDLIRKPVYLSARRKIVAKIIRKQLAVSGQVDVDQIVEETGFSKELILYFYSESAKDPLSLDCTLPNDEDVEFYELVANDNDSKVEDMVSDQENEVALLHLIKEKLSEKEWYFFYWRVVVDPRLRKPLYTLGQQYGITGEAVRTKVKRIRKNLTRLINEQNKRELSREYTGSVEPAEVTEASDLLQVISHHVSKQEFLFIHFLCVLNFDMLSAYIKVFPHESAMTEAQVLDYFFRLKTKIYSILLRKISKSSDAVTFAIIKRKLFHFPMLDFSRDKKDFKSLSSTVYVNRFDGEIWQRFFGEHEKTMGSFSFSEDFSGRKVTAQEIQDSLVRIFFKIKDFSDVANIRDDIAPNS